MLSLHVKHFQLHNFSQKTSDNYCRRTIRLQQLTEDFAYELNDLVLKNKGNVNLYIHLVDEESPGRIKLFSRQHRIQINKKVYHSLKRAQAEEILEFQVG